MIKLIDKKMSRMRPCVKKAFEEGARDRDHFQKMRYAIIFELNRLRIEKSKIKTALLEWNKRNFRHLSENDAKRQLCFFVEWFFSHECMMSCKALKDYCLYQNGGCCFKQETNLGQVVLPFSLTEMESYVGKECAPHGYLMTCLVKILLKIQRERGIGGRVFVGYRTLMERILNEYNHKIDLMTILRTTKILENEKILRIEHGRSGDLRRKANGYTFLPWVPPTTHITHLCNTIEKNEGHYCVTTQEKAPDTTDIEPPSVELQYSNSPFLKEGRSKAIKEYLDKNKIPYDYETVLEIEKKLTPHTKIEDLLNKEQSALSKPVNSPKCESIIPLPDGRYKVMASVWPNYKKQWTSPVPCDHSVAEDKMHEMINALKAQREADRKPVTQGEQKEKEAVSSVRRS